MGGKEGKGWRGRVGRREVEGKKEGKEGKERGGEWKEGKGEEAMRERREGSE